MQESDIYKQAMAYAQGYDAAHHDGYEQGFTKGFKAGYEFFKAVTEDKPNCEFTIEYEGLEDIFPLAEIRRTLKRLSDVES